MLHIAEAAARISTLQHFVIHSMSAGEKIAGPEYVVPHCESKDRAVDEIKTALPALAKKSTFMFVGSFTQNVWTRPFLKPSEIRTAKGKFVWLLPISSTTKMTFAGDAYHNVGVFVYPMLSHPEITLPAKYVIVTADEMTMAEAFKVSANDACPVVEEIIPMCSRR